MYLNQSQACVSGRFSLAPPEGLSSLALASAHSEKL